MQVSHHFMMNAQKAWLGAGVTLQDARTADALWQLLKQYPSVAAMVEAARANALREGDHGRL